MCKCPPLCVFVVCVVWSPLRILYMCVHRSQMAERLSCVWMFVTFFLFSLFGFFSN
uniref:Uncharacterized protein n=1 Tax=Anguilla anguilla TaxID=7936 RepID=A0A0E9VUM5_ANGAN